ncbi:hypothetical protein SUGI_0578230 [Cryptomeria japonica]|nr:hypothetical protein SUGI_0578230 [Cryptomeria japonica]
MPQRPGGETHTRPMSHASNVVCSCTLEFIVTSIFSVLWPSSSSCGFVSSPRYCFLPSFRRVSLLLRQTSAFSLMFCLASWFFAPAMVDGFGSFSPDGSFGSSPSRAIAWWPSAGRRLPRLRVAVRSTLRARAWCRSRSLFWPPPFLPPFGRALVVSPRPRHRSLAPPLHSHDRATQVLSAPPCMLAVPPFAAGSACLLPR